MRVTSKTIIRLTAFAVAALLTASCGFAPIYAQPGSELAQLRDISVRSAERTRLDYAFEQAMADKLGAYAPSGAFVLEASLRERRQGFGLRIDDVATRYESNVTANYRLIRTSDGAVLTRGRRTGSASYDVINDPYAELVSEESAQDRAAELAAEKIRLDLAIYFANAEDRAANEQGGGAQTASR